MTKFKTPYTPYEPQKEKVRGKSLTVPDQSLSIQELLTRYANGMPLGIKEKTFLDNDKLIFPDVDWEKLDLAEREELIETAKLEQRELKEKIKKDLQDAQNERIRKADEEFKNLQQKMADALRNAEKLPQN